MKRTTLLLVAAVTVAALMLAGGCRKDESTAKLGLEPGAAATSPESSASSATSATSEAAGKSPTSSSATTAASNGNGSATGGAGASGSNSNKPGSPTGGTAKPSGPGTKPSAPVKTTALKILWWNDTVSKKATGCEVAYGSAAFRPDVSQDAATGLLKAVPVGKTVNLVVYPDGRSGKKIIVPFKVDSYMKASTDQDAIHVAVSDDTIKVLGNPVEGFEVEFDRF